MIAYLKNNMFFTCILIISLIVLFLLQSEEQHNMLVLLFGGFLFLVFTVKKAASISDFYMLIVFLAPFSMGMAFTDGFKLSFPSEALTLVIIFLFLTKAVWGMKVNLDFIKHPISILLIADLIWALITTITSEMFDVSLKRFLLKFIFIIAYFFIIISLEKREKQFNLYYFYGLGLIIPILSTFARHYQYNFSQPSSIDVIRPFYDDHTLYAACIAFVLPYFLLNTSSTNKNTKWLSMLMSGIFIIAVLTSYSRAAWISLLAAGVIYLLLKLKVKFKHLFFSLIIGLVIVSVNFDTIYNSLRSTEIKYDENVTTHLSSVTNLENDASNLERINRWVCAMRMFQEKPLTGFGPGTYQFTYDRFQTKEYMTRISTHNGDKGNAHSEYFSYLSESGVIGLIVFTCIVFYSLYLGMRLLYGNISQEHKIIVTAALLGLVTFYIHGLFNTFSDYEKMSVLYLGSLGILVQMDLKSKNHKPY